MELKDIERARKGKRKGQGKSKEKARKGGMQGENQSGCNALKLLFCSHMLHIIPCVHLHQAKSSYRTLVACKVWYPIARMHITFPTFFGLDPPRTSTAPKQTE